MAPYHILLYYFYTPIEDAETFALEHLKYCKTLGVRGRIIVAHEGLNGSISGSPEQCQQYMDDLRADKRFEGIEFKIDESEDHAFNRLHVRYKSEIVHSGLRDPSIINPRQKTGVHIDGKTFLEMKEQDDVVVVDVRSNYEHGVGRFKNAITFDMENFREFPEKVKQLEALKGKKIITYCTGGIKCEKASALLLEHGFEDVYQLHGGIIKYAKETGGKDFDGVCYVFDGRITVPVNEVNPTIISNCHICNIPTLRMVNCANVECNEHLPICEDCGEKLEGACSETCKEHPRKRPYNGTGYYVRPPVEVANSIK
ncbi:MAG: rhodanese-related sulfurtransferase [Bacteroidota bacterium]|nr:rhodanese-related sulfurtransferase [Bacteroidota bacterium]